MTAEEAAQEHQRRAKECLEKAAFEQCMALLRVNKHACSGVLVHLRNIGITPESSTSVPQSRLAESIKLRGQRIKFQRELPHPSIPQALLDVHPASEFMPSKTNALEDFKVGELQEHCLAVCEPIIWSMSNIRSRLVRSRSNEGTKQTILRIIEYISRITGDFEIRGELRLWANWEAWILRLYEKNGSRGRLLQLPPVWSTEGEFLAEKVVVGVRLQHRLTGVSLVYPLEFEDFEATKVAVANNWSLTRAALMIECHTQADPIALHEYFVRVSVQYKKSAGKVMLALGDADSQPASCEGTNSETAKSSAFTGSDSSKRFGVPRPASHDARCRITAKRARVVARPPQHVPEVEMLPEPAEPADGDDTEEQAGTEEEPPAEDRA